MPHVRKDLGVFMTPKVYFAKYIQSPSLKFLMCTSLEV